MEFVALLKRLGVVVCLVNRKADRESLIMWNERGMILFGKYPKIK